MHSISSSYNRTENMWTLRKTITSIEIDFNGLRALQLHFSDFGEKCEEIGGWNVNWINIWTEVHSDLQYRPQQRGTQIYLMLIFARKTAKE